MGNSSSRNRPIWANIQPTQAIYQQNNGVYEQYLPSKGWLWNLFHPDKRRRERALREYWYTTPTLWQYPAAPTYPASVGYAQPGYVQQAYPAAQPLAPGPANMAAAAMMSTPPTQMPIPEPAPPPGSFSPVIPDMDFAYGATPRSRSHGHHRRRRSSLSGSYSDDDSSLDYGSPLSDTLSDSSDYSPRRRRHSHHSHSYRSHSSHGHNPLPRPPRDVLTRTPYRNILQELPSTRAYY